ncbi:MAG: hypothetical protein K8F91_05515 [Candidatus Obscuribacterales bacterium]|nr:hypothetical protein [Candidatus Obscuribacterales bacterium]
MRTKTKRQSLILSLISSQPVRTQRELQDKLEKEGWQVNQATLSRDIAELGLSKILLNGVQRYASQEQLLSTTTTNSASVKELSRFVRAIELSHNMLVIKTDSGAASHVAEAIDALSWKEIIGTIAGDNTIFLVVSEASKASDTARRLKKQFQL